MPPSQGQPATAPDEELKVTSEKRGKYELLGRIGHGGMAEVYLARQHGPMGFEKLVCIKRLLPHFQSETQFVNMFLDEARIAARINHPNVVQIFELAKGPDGYFIAMEFLPGESMARVMGEGLRRNETLSPRLAASAVARVCEGLHHAHTLTDTSGGALGVVHRDVSPQNVMLLYDGRVKVLDFGIAKARQRVAEDTVHGLKGKYAYMSPEQCLGRPVDARSDIFSCGILLWELLALRRLFKHQSKLMIMRMIVEGRVVSPTVINSEVPEALSQIALKALAKKEEGRFASAEEMAFAIDEALASSTDQTGRAGIAHYMQRVFGDDEKTQREWINTALSPTGIRVQKTGEQWLDLVPEADQQSVFFGAGEKTASAVPSRWTLSWVLPVLLAGTAFLAVLVALFWRDQAPISPRLRVGSDPPGATIVVNDTVYSAPTPATITDLSEGPHVLELRLAAHASWRQTILLSPGETLHVRPQLEKLRPPPEDSPTPDPATPVIAQDTPLLPQESPPKPPPKSKRPPSKPRPAAVTQHASAKTGYLNLVTEPWAAIYHEGKKIGDTPLVRVELPAGPIVLRAENREAGFSRSFTVTIRPDELIRLRIDLTTRK